MSDYQLSAIQQETEQVELAKAERIKLKQAKIKAKNNQKKKQLLAKLIAPILLILTVIIAFFLQLTAP